MPDDLDDVTGPEDLEDLEDDSFEALDVDAVDDLGEDLDDIALDDEEDADAEIDIDDVGDDIDEEDIEASLDVILKERLVVDEDLDDEPTDAEDRSEIAERVLPKQPDEFVCRSCFLVKNTSQLADKDKMLCRDCV